MLSICFYISIHNYWHMSICFVLRDEKVFFILCYPLRKPICSFANFIEDRFWNFYFSLSPTVN